jgi:hypothetical protein
MARIAAVVNQKHRDEIVATQLVELDGQLQAVFESASICIFLADRDARVDRTNAALACFFNKESHAMTSHIPNKGEQMVRYYGYYRNAPGANGKKPEPMESSPACSKRRKPMFKSEKPGLT